MIPATFGTLLGFLGLVAPGLVYSAIIERRRPREGESAFAEASRVGLTSLVFSLVSMVLLWLLQRYESSALYKYTKLSLPNIGLWLAGGNKYAAGNLGKVFSGLRRKSYSPVYWRLQRHGCSPEGPGRDSGKKACTGVCLPAMPPRILSRGFMSNWMTRPSSGDIIASTKTGMERKQERSY